MSTAVSPLPLSGVTLDILRRIEDRVRTFRDWCQPPARKGLTFEAIVDDARNVIRSVALRYADESHAILNLEGLVSEGLVKLAEIVRTEAALLLDRGKFFAYLKTAVKRHLLRLVAREKFTFKRTGAKAPKRDATEQEREQYRLSLPEHVSLDATRFDDTSYGESLGGLDALDEQMKQDLRAVLSKSEIFVFEQLIDPDYEAWVYASTEAGWDERTDYARPGHAQVRIDFKHMAKGLDLALSEFEKIVQRIKNKVKIYMQSGEAFHHEHGRTLRCLEEVFHLRHTPRTIEQTAVRRLFTIAARDQHQKVTPEVARMLEQIGAKPPQLQSQSLSCFGVLFQANHRLCGACGRRAACSVEASNVGLGEITLSPALLGTKVTRIPAIVAGPQTESPVFEEETMEEVYAFLTENFHRVVLDGEHYFRHHGGWAPSCGITISGNAGLIFHVQGGRLRFCKPSAALVRKLKTSRSVGTVGESFCLPDDFTAGEAVDLVSQHAKETLSDKYAETTP